MSELSYDVSTEYLNVYKKKVVPKGGVGKGGNHPLLDLKIIYCFPSPYLDNLWHLTLPPPSISQYMPVLS